MRPFGYAAPATVDQAVGLLEAEGSEALAGGTDLLSLLKDDVERVERLVALGGVTGLSGIELDGGMLRIGAMTTLQELRDHDDAIAALPALSVGAKGVGEPTAVATSAAICSSGPGAGTTVGASVCWRWLPTAARS